MLKFGLKIWLCTSFVLAGLAPASALAEPPARPEPALSPATHAAIDALIAAEMKKATIPGLALAIVRDGQVVLAQGYGFANLEHLVPVSPETMFQSGSLGKQFTATAVMMLVEAGKLRLDVPVATYLPGVPASWKAITIRHLLNHTSGLSDYPEDFDYRRDYTEAELLAAIAATPLAFAPGTRWQYSNLGYVTLGILLSKVTGHFYGDFLQARLFAPAGMKTARIISEAAIVPHRAEGYQLDDGTLVHQDWVSPTLNTTADGSLYLSLLDLVHWDQTLYSEKLLKTASLQQMWTTTRLHSGEQVPYGFGWSVQTVNGHRLVEHGGAWQGFRTHMARYLDDRLSFIVLANSAQADATRIAHKVARLYDAGLSAPVASAIADTEPEVTARFKNLLLALAASRADAGQFDQKMQQALFPERILDVGRFLAAKGELQRFELVMHRQKGPTKLYQYRLSYPSGQLWMQVSLEPDGKISGLFFKPIED